ncbi:MAG: YicC family protein [Thermodesulfobacteria bacterium]|nr:YicC family protein [Thermodesulfobacteriota bacterium]
MLRSMTTYAKAEASGPDWTLSLELKSVNSRYFDLHLRAPREMSGLEDRIRRYLKEKFIRGRVDLYINYETFGDAPAAFEPKLGLAKGYLEAVAELGDALGIEHRLKMSELLMLLRDAIIPKEEQIDIDTLWQRLKEPLEELTISALDMARKEGAATERDIRSRLKRIEELAAQIEARAQENLALQQEKLKERILSRLSDMQLDEQRLIVEAAVLADRLDINEELVRLKSHISQFYKYLEIDEQIGRKLDFLLQEIFREVNTITSKSCDSVISHLVVEIKSEVEKIREQLQNIV